MPTYRYILAPYTKDSKINCPSCGGVKAYRRYLDITENVYLDSEYGICDREKKCGHHYSPYQFPPNNNNIVVEDGEIHKLVSLKKDDTYNIISKDLVKKSFVHKFEDNFSLFLFRKFGKTESKKVITMYRVGCSTLFGGNSTIFWQIDKDFNIRSGKIMKYDKNGKRVKQPYPKISWVHNKYKGRYKLTQCFFGLHILNKYKEKPIAIVEAEKTAIIASIVKPKYIWLATGGLNNINSYKLKEMQDRDIVFFPDKGVLGDWEKRIKQLGFTGNFDRTVEDCTDLEDGDDLADWILEVLPKINPEKFGKLKK